MMSSDGLALGPGCFVTGLEYSADVKAQVVGKPQPEFFRMALEKLKLIHPQVKDEKSENFVMIGDDVRDDVQGAITSGLQGCLVQTGKYRQGDEKNLPDEALMFPSFSQAIEAWYA